MEDKSSDVRIEHDSLGEVSVPASALYGAQTQRAVENFPISGYRLSPSIISALGRIKYEAAKVNAALGLIPEEIAKTVMLAAGEVVENLLDEHFPVDIFQTGSGTSSNMNANEVIAHRACQIDNKVKVHPNDHVNFGQSSNDVFPAAGRIAACYEIKNHLLPSLDELRQAFMAKEKQYNTVVRTGRTHLMDAMPVTFGQLFSGYERQLVLGRKGIEHALGRVSELPLGGTATGTGINTHPEFAGRVINELNKKTGISFREAENHFEAQGSVDALVELGAQMKNLAVSLMKIVNDLRWMNSGPNAGLGEIALPAVQPGSSIMPGKVNPVIEESVAMVCAQVIGFEAVVTVGGISGNFELNVMQPVVITNIMESIRLLANAMTNLARRSVSGLEVREAHVCAQVNKNPILVTSLTPLIGYELAAKIAKKAFSENLSVKEVAMSMCDLDEETLDKTLDPLLLSKGGLVGPSHQ